MWVNELFGWAWIALGFASGAVLGLSFHRATFLGGYDAWPRRLLRLGHIAFVALGVLNLLFVSTATRWGSDHALWNVASICFIVGGVLMPLCCGLAAWRPRSRVLFPAPVLALVVAVSTTIVGLAEAGGVL